MFSNKDWSMLWLDFRCRIQKMFTSKTPNIGSVISTNLLLLHTSRAPCSPVERVVAICCRELYRELYLWSLDSSFEKHKKFVKPPQKQKRDSYVPYSVLLRASLLPRDKWETHICLVLRKQKTPIRVFIFICSTTQNFYSQCIYTVHYYNRRSEHKWIPPIQQ